MVKLTSSLLTLAAVGFATFAEAAPAPRAMKHIIAVQAHRGGLGLRPESTAFAFAYALEIGANVLEMDMVFTKDGVPVIWHDHKISSTKCRDTAVGGENSPYVDKFIADLTLKQLKTLDCGSQQLSNHLQAKLAPGAQIQTLEEVLDLVECYGDKRIEINLETKIDPVAPGETKPVENYINDIVPILKRRGFDKRTYIQSFDWRTIIGIKKKFPWIRTVALLDDTTIVPEDRGVSGYPWLGGIDLEKDFGGDFVKAAKSIKATVLSPVHGTGAGTVNSPTYKPFVNAEIVKKAHKLGLQVIPWTVDNEVDIDRLITDGVDAIISNYPERVKYVGQDRGFLVGSKRRDPRPQCLKNAALPL
ncbi:glycerophosphoryl diester phosphodiesterase [Kalaharituber pfeilii]|nr:glycerophosphoryl diester phosphodiesterase [Kalaharituber pfeilii]